MRDRRSTATRTAFVLTLAGLLSLAAAQANAFPQTLNAWQDRYGVSSTSGDDASCQLCHAESNGGSPWNGYGWDIRDAYADAATCDLNLNGVVSHEEAFFCVEMLNSDGDGSGNDNALEIGLSTQPGWTAGANNTLYARTGTTPNQLPPADIGTLDPDGTEPPPEPPPPPPDDDADLPPGQTKRNTIVVKPGDSIQEALNRAEEGTRIYILSGTYSEVQNPTNGLNVTKSGIQLVGQTGPGKRVVFENAGSQRNGIVIVPPENTDCMSCHETMAPPFSLLPGVEPGLPDPEPLLYDIEVRGITIEGFRNNGLFTERVDGFKIIDVYSKDNRNYGIFPTLSRNGLITHSKATGSDTDSGIWVETSENVVVTYNYVSDNVNGFEVSNSDDILLAHNEAENNTIGAAILLLPDIFDDRPGANRIDMRDNHFHHNNKDNTARPGSILSFIPPGIGILHLGVDNSVIENNVVEHNDFVGIAISDYCLPLFGVPGFQCPPPFGHPAVPSDPTITPAFLADQSATNNVVRDNVVVDNAGGVTPPPFGDFEGDLSLLTFDHWGNCYDNNVFSTFFSTIGVLPPCP